jgi:Ran GTPase-activating protein 1
MISEALKKCHERNAEMGRPDSLRMLVIGRNRMESPGAISLVQSLKYYDSLRHIQLPQNSIRPDGIAVLMEGLKSCKNLEFIDLQDNTFTLVGSFKVNLGSKAMADALPSWPELRVLNIGDCLLGKEGGIDILR